MIYIYKLKIFIIILFIIHIMESHILKIIKSKNSDKEYMESNMLKMLKSKNSDKEYPSNTGQKWTDEEETLLLQELSKNMDLQLIAQSHKRTIGGIYTRQKLIAYKMHCNNNSMEEIIIKTKLDEDQIKLTIKRRCNKKEKKIESKTTPLSKISSLENEVIIMKTEISELKNIIKELTELIMKAFYESNNE